MPATDDKMKVISLLLFWTHRIAPDIVHSSIDLAPAGKDRPAMQVLCVLLLHVWIPPNTLVPEDDLDCNIVLVAAAAAAAAVVVPTRLAPRPTSRHESFARRAACTRFA